MTLESDLQESARTGEELSVRRSLASALQAVLQLSVCAPGNHDFEKGRRGLGILTLAVFSSTHLSSPVSLVQQHYKI
jgi:hypothetical protein